MSDKVSEEINKRFFEAFDALIARGDVRSSYQFCTDRKIDRRNFDRLRAEPRRKFPLSLIRTLVLDFGVSADWIVTGRGVMFN